MIASHLLFGFPDDCVPYVKSYSLSSYFHLMEISIEKFAGEDGKTIYAVVSIGRVKPTKELKRIQSSSKLIFEKIDYQETDPDNAVWWRLYEAVRGQVSVTKKPKLCL
jgi:hypothetical protein